MSTFQALCYKTDRMKTYHGGRDRAGRVHVWIADSDAPEQAARELTHIPVEADGFEYGYRGNGPRDLALALLADYLGEFPSAARIRQPEGEIFHCVMFRSLFVADVLARLDYEYPWSMTEGFLAAWYKQACRR